MNGKCRRCCCAWDRLYELYCAACKIEILQQRIDSLEAQIRDLTTDKETP